MQTAKYLFDMAFFEPGTTELDKVDFHIRIHWNMINLTLKEGSDDYVKALERLAYYYKKRQQILLQTQ